MSELYYDDFAVGDTYEFDGVRLSRTDIVEFGRQYDPLPFHTDEDAAMETPYGGVIASGLQTFAVSQRQVVDHLYRRAAIYGSVGFDELAFPNPVRPGDTLYTSLEVLGKRPSESDPSRGLVTVERTVDTQAGATVLRAVNNVLFERTE